MSAPPDLPDPATEPLGGAALGRFVHPSATGTVPPLDKLMARPSGESTPEEVAAAREDLAARIRADREPQPATESKTEQPSGTFGTENDATQVAVHMAAMPGQDDGRRDAAFPTMERASVAAPRPELDWTRDWQGRPRILPDPTWDPERVTEWQLGRANDQGEVPYTRVTTFAEALQDSSALTRWKLRRAVLGMGRRPDYVTTAAALTTDDRDRDALDDLAEKALEAAGPNAADVGTALHSFTERIDRGEELGHVPDEYREGLEAYRRQVAHLTFVEWECRTVCDELETAGTPDRMGFCDVPDPDGVVDELRVIDTKTGRVDYSAGKFSTQLAIYRRSKLYHPGTGARTSWEDAHGKPVSRWGVVVHMPAGAGTAELLWIGLDHGWSGAEKALQVREWRKGASADRLLVPMFARAPRPATTDGTCRGRKADGKACTYRAKRVGGELTPWCGRHQSQQTDLDRWLAENPGTDPASGVEVEPARDPVQPSTPPASVTVTESESRAAVEDERRGELAEAEELDGDDSYPDHGPADDAAAAMGLPSRTAGTLDDGAELGVPDARSMGDHGWIDDPDDRAARPARELNLTRGTYAIDPATEQNGNRRPQSGLSFPELAAEAAQRAEAALLAQISAAQSPEELGGIYRQAGPTWTPRCDQWATARVQQIRDERARARPEAALLAAIATAHDQPALIGLHRAYGGGGLWTPEVDAAAAARFRELS